MSTKITGKKITLRDWELADTSVFANWNTGHHRWMDFDGPYYAKFTPAELVAHKEKKQKLIENQDFPNPRMNLIIADPKTNLMIGMVSCYWISKETNWLAIGLVIYDEANWSKGIGYESLYYWISYLFDNRPELVRLGLRSWSGNHGMCRLAEKLGFQLEARFRMARIVKGEYYDSVGYGILRTEFEAFDYNV